MAKVLFISDNFPPVLGGSATVYDQICRNGDDEIVGLSSQNYYSTGITKETTEYDQNCGFSIHRISNLRSSVPSSSNTSLIHRALNLFRDLKVCARVSLEIAFLCKRKGIDVICIGELVYLGWIAYLAHYILRIPSIVYCHGEEISQSSLGFFPAMRRRFLMRCDRIIAVSHFCKSEIVSRYRIRPKKIEVLLNGVDLTLFGKREKNQDLVSRFQLEGKTVVVAAGRHVPRKGFDNLIRSLPRVLQSCPNAHLLLLSDGPQTSELEGIAVEHGVKDHVTFVGTVPQAQLPDFYNLGEVFAMPNRTMSDGDREGFGLVFVEANACGVPTIGGISGGSIEAIDDGVSGRLIDGNDVPSISNRIIEVLSNTSFRELLSNNGYVRAQSMGWVGKSQEFKSIAKSLLLNRPISLRSDQSEEKQSPRVGGGPTLTVSIDLEECFDWNDLQGPASVVKGADELEEFQFQCQSRGVVPTYFATFPILQCTRFVSILKEASSRGECEVGIHPHPWNTPPVFETLNVYNSFQGNLPKHIERAKLETLVALYREIFGRLPVSHRAGRYGLGCNTAEILVDLGIKIDSSISTNFDFSAEGGPDFSDRTGCIEWTGQDSNLLSLPVSGARLTRGPIWLSKLKKNPLGLSEKAVRLTPEGTQLSWMQAAAEQNISAQNINMVLSLHSSSLVVGGSPYSNDRRDISEMTKRLFGFLKWAKEERGVRFFSAEQVLMEIHKKSGTQTYV